MFVMLRSTRENTRLYILWITWMSQDCSKIVEVGCALQVLRDGCLAQLGSLKVRVDIRIACFFGGSPWISPSAASCRSARSQCRRTAANGCAPPSKTPGASGGARSDERRSHERDSVVWATISCGGQGLGESFL